MTKGNFKLSWCLTILWARAFLTESTVSVKAQRYTQTSIASTSS